MRASGAAVPAPLTPAAALDTAVQRAFENDVVKGAIDDCFDRPLTSDRVDRPTSTEYLSPWS